MSKFCRYCGAKLDENISFCTKCGNKTDNDGILEVSNTYKDQPVMQKVVKERVSLLLNIGQKSKDVINKV